MGDRKTPGKRGPDDARGRAEAAAEIARSAKKLREKADANGLSVLSYLLDMITLEALDIQRAARVAGKAAGTEKGGRDTNAG